MLATISCTASANDKVIEPVTFKGGITISVPSFFQAVQVNSPLSATQLLCQFCLR